MQFDTRRFASLVSWVISPVVVAPAVYLLVVLYGYSATPHHLDWFLVLLLSATIAPMFLILGLKKIGRISDYNISFREQRFLPLLVLVGVNLVGYELMKQLDAPRFLSGILLFNAVNTVFILLVTLQWKISIHLFSLTSSIALLVLSLGAPALALLCFVPLLMWSRIYLRAHNFMQTLVGSLIGFLLMFGEFKWWLAL
ncbi:phosphatase PAP2 family protein [Chlorobaculum thiosulfatiphilum]|jgi:membrane-associated phospholipid phosphatase|uniref:Phosphatase PAP2 family protein n=1 Tax=Chlorobaculum thiosulfatiphilum TaxID=115852 RepID=A0A5C4S625_CHLTI|nr:phosphatase PAP2 family protein [Chlorobaculum thiosulfatiphilum]TNJ38479.1 phosphatase PAP2 family protein [Chlorobaculum thiosulfatiphilum]